MTNLNQALKTINYPCIKSMNPFSMLILVKTIFGFLPCRNCVGPPQPMRMQDFFLTIINHIIWCQIFWVIGFFPRQIWFLFCYKLYMVSDLCLSIWQMRSKKNYYTELACSAEKGAQMEQSDWLK